MSKQIELQIHEEMFNKFYYPYLMDYSTKYEVHKGSAGSGKSYFITQKLIIKALQSKRKILVIRKVASTNKDSTWTLFKDVLEQFQMLDKCTINKSDYEITLPNKSVFLFKGLDNSEKIKSITGISDIFVEEATELFLDDVTQLKLRLRGKQGNCQIYFAFNPIGKTNWVYDFFKFTPENQSEKIRELPYTKIFSTTYKDNKFLSDDYIQTLMSLKEENYIKYLIYTEGIFCSGDKLVYTNWITHLFDYQEILKRKNAVAIFGLDFGYINDNTAFIGSILDDETMEIFIFCEHFEKGMLNNQIADMIKRKGFRKEIIIADSAERKSIDELKKLGITRIKPSKKGKGSIRHGVQKLQQYKLIVHPSCVNIIEELQNYSYKKDKNSNEYTNEINDNHNHGLDALRYSLQAIKAIPTIIKIRL